ncbi:MAG: restriction endonuclease [Acidobacteria bacterium]|nr:restriction endonuclease [Acidobacteriota bacterium]
MIETEEFEGILDLAVKQLNKDVRENSNYHDPQAFEKRVLVALQETAEGRGIKISPSFHPHAFPDIIANGFGVEVKSTTKESWASVGNSVFEGMRDPSVLRLYVVFGRFGGMPAVKWGRYEERITHVRISHAPRFVLEMDRDAPLFQQMNTTYDEFSRLSSIEKMRHIRAYSRGRLKPGETMWWLEENPGEEKTLPLEVRVYMKLSGEEKKKLRAEAALLCPEIVKGSRARNKYDRAALYILTVHGVFCPQTRDLFSAGSVAGKERGGNYLLRALRNIQNEMREAALRLDGRLVEEYWGIDFPPQERIKEWLKRADRNVQSWKPSEHLFKEEQKK